jgi:hypothetical protein
MHDMNPVEAVALAYVWGLPLVTMHRTRQRQGADAALARRDRLSTAADRDVVAPNNDTLYASGWFDLAGGDVWIEVAPTDGRYWSVMLLDAYTHVRYVSRRTHGSAGCRVRVTFDPGAVPAGDDRVGIGTRTVWVLSRVVVDGPDDLPAARAVQAGIRVRAAVGGSGARPIPAAGAPASFVDELAVAVAVDPPAAIHAPMPAALAALLAEPSPPADVVAAGVERGRQQIAAARGGADRAANGWGTRVRGADFGDDIVYRAAFAATSLGGHLPVENRSYTRLGDGSRPAVLRFGPGAAPPVRAFWSLTVYGPDLFFVPNPIDRYSVGDRTPGLVLAPDGSLSIELAPEPSGPPSNWLPTPAGPYVLSLRAYEGEPPVVDARWFPPDLSPRPRSDSA